LAFTLDYRMVGSGGCVEGAVVEAGLSPVARGCFPQAWPTRGDRPGLRRADRGLRCAALAHVIWERALARQTPTAAATIIDGLPTLLSGRLLLDVDGEASNLSDARLRQQLSTAAQDAIRADISSRQVTLTPSDGEARIEVIAPPIMLIIVDALHIATVLAKGLGYRVIVIDLRSAFASQERFPHADQIIVAHPSGALKAESLTSWTAVLVLTPSYTTQRCG